MKTREKAVINERLVLETIKLFPQVNGYYEVSYVTLANKSGVPYGSISNIIKRLQKKGIIEVKQSFAMFGSMMKRGIKILKEAR